MVFDVPATMDMASSALQVANLADGVIMVVEAERTGWHVVKEARDLLRQANAEILGVVLNKRKFYVPDWLYRRV